MKSYRCLTLVLSLSLTLAPAALAQAQDETQKRRPGVADAGKVEAPLLPGGAEEKLKLTAEQKAKISSLEKEFAEKIKGTDSKIQEAMAKARQDKDRAAYKKAMEDMEAARTLRSDYLAKVSALLDADQKKKYEAARANSGTPVKRPGAALLGGNALPLLNPNVQERLELSAEQKEKLNALVKDVENNLLKVLNEDQKKKYEELKKGPTRKRLPQQQQTGNRKGVQRAVPVGQGRQAVLSRKSPV